MPQFTMTIDEGTANTIREAAKKNNVSLSHYLNNLIQRGLMLENNVDDLGDFLKQPRLISSYKKLLAYGLENLALTQYLVKNLGDDSFSETNQRMLDKAKQHAESYVAGLFED